MADKLQLEKLYWGAQTMAEAGEREFATEVVRRLAAAGHEALFAGGCVRDELLGLQPDDYDVASSATPDEVRKLFRRSIAVGASFGVIEVLGPPGQKGPLKVQVATFRTDGDYADGRRPNSVIFGSAREDALRRDFTINGMFLNPVTNEVLDYVGGREDLSAGYLRAIGDPEKRFEEDRLRLARAVRMAARFNLKVDEGTSRAIKRHASAIAVVSAERVADELRKMLRHPNRAEAIQLLESHCLLGAVLPELAEQSKSYADHLPMVLAGLKELPARASFEMALAMVLTDCDASKAGSISRRLKLANEERDQLQWLLANARALDSSKSMSRHKLFPILSHIWVQGLLACGFARLKVSNQPATGLEHAVLLIETTTVDILNPLPLVNGADLQEAGILPGPVMGKLLRQLRDEQLDGFLATREQSLERAMELAK